jgi:hypothetical protein
MKIKYREYIFCKTVFLSMLLLFFGFHSIAQIVEWQWAKTAIVHTSYMSGVVSDNKGNCYMAGSFWGSPAYFGNIQLNNSNLNQPMALVTKYDSSGNAIWASCGGGFKGSTVADAIGIALDKTGHCFITGLFTDTVVFGNDTLISRGWYDIFVAKYDTSGNLIWVKSAGGHNQFNDWPYAIISDSIGNCYVTGYFTGSAIFESDTLNSFGYSDIFIASYDTNGNLRWVKQAGGIGEDVGQGISLYGNKIYLTGNFDHTAVFFNDTISSVGISDVFLAEYDTSGQFIRVKSAGGPKEDQAHALTHDRWGNCFITGFSSDSAIFGTDTVRGDGVFISKCDSALNFLWTKHENGFYPHAPPSHSGNAITTDEAGNCYITGNYYDTLIFGIDTMISVYNFDIFVYKFNSSGNVLWKISAADNGGYSKGISLDPDGNCYIAGGTGGTAIFGSTTIMGYGAMYLAKIGCIASQPEITLSNSNLHSTIATTYQWYFNGNIIPGATSQSYTPQLYGDYVVKTKDANGCSALSLPFNFTGVGNSETGNENVIFVSPNPSSDYFIFNIPSRNEIRRIKIQNALGKVILSSSNSKINLSGFAGGVYFYTVETRVGDIFRGRILKTD